MHVFALPERSPGRVIAAIGLMFALAYSSSLILFPKPDGRLLVGDALHHYVQLRSAVFDRDLRFQNEYVRLYGLRGGEPDTEWVYASTPTGHTRNLMPVGPALLWAPAFLLVAAAVWLSNLAGAAYPLDGYTRVFQATAAFTGIAAAAAGVWLSYLTNRELTGPRAAIWASLVMWLSSSALYYSVISPTYSHASSMLAVSAFWFVFVKTRGSLTSGRYAALGALAGACALMRWQDAILLAIPALDLAWHLHTRRLSFPKALRAAALCVTAAAIVFIPQMIVWQTLYGRPLAVPQGAGFLRWTDPALAQILFSDNHGLFTWTPVVFLGLAGLVPLARRDRLVAIAATAFFAMSWFVNAAAADWWAGEAFGARRFVSCYPVFALGLAALIERWAPRLRTLAIAGSVAIGYTFLLLLQYQAFMKGLRQIAPYPRGGFDLWLARFVVPLDLLEWWLSS